MTGLSGLTKVFFGLVLILQPMAGHPVVQAVYSAQGTVLTGPTLPPELDKRPEERRYDVAQPLTGAPDPRRCPMLRSRPCWHLLSRLPAVGTTPVR